MHQQIPEFETDILYMEVADLPKALIDGAVDAFSMRNPVIQEAKDSLGDNASVTKFAIPTSGGDENGRQV
jgi:hypothetical protein